MSSIWQRLSWVLLFNYTFTCCPVIMTAITNWSVFAAGLIDALILARFLLLCDTETDTTLSNTTERFFLLTVRIYKFSVTLLFFVLVIFVRNNWSRLIEDYVAISLEAVLLLF